MILVVGCGFVGEAVAKSLEEDEQKVVRIDPKLNDYQIKDYLGNIQAAIVCVPTPTVDGKCDDSIVRKVIDELRDTPTMLKSTVPPHLVEQYPENVVYSPEFLRASSADEDFKNQKYMILGGKRSSTLNWTFKQMFSYLDATEPTQLLNSPNEISFKGLLKIGSQTDRIAFSNASTSVSGGTHPDSKCASATPR